LALRFARMHGAGNDFVILHDPAGRLAGDRAALARALCDRRRGIGGDGLILVGPPSSSGPAFSMTYVNADGGDAAMCGNGARCALRRAVDLGLVDTEGAFETGSGILRGRVDGSEVRLSMPNPTDERPARILDVDGEALQVFSIDTGVPHAVLFADDVLAVDAAARGRAVRQHASFAPPGTNVNFVQVLDKGRLRVRTYERGVEGETLACGTGAVASALVCSRLGLAASPVSIETQSGETLRVGFESGPDSSFHGVTLAGPTELVATGEIDDGWLSRRALPTA
jgi:diaminopimelate epimerase